MKEQNKAIAEKQEIEEEALVQVAGGAGTDGGGMVGLKCKNGHIYKLTPAECERRRAEQDYPECPTCGEPCATYTPLRRKTVPEKYLL